MKNILTFSILSLFLISSVSAELMIRTQSPTAFWEADGITAYRVDVIAEGDNTEKYTGVKWSIYVPDYFTLVNASLPSANDFFANHTFNVNQIDAQIQYYETDLALLRDNYRFVNDYAQVGFRRYLGSYWFTVNPNYSYQGLYHLPFENNSLENYYTTNLSKKPLTLIRKTPTIEYGYWHIVNQHELQCCDAECTYYC